MNHPNLKQWATLQAAAALRGVSLERATRGPDWRYSLRAPGCAELFYTHLFGHAPLRLTLLQGALSIGVAQAFERDLAHVMPAPA